MTSDIDKLQSQNNSKARRPYRWWHSKQGFEEAVSIVKEFKKENNRLPTNNEMITKLRLSAFLLAVAKGVSFAENHATNLQEFFDESGLTDYVPEVNQPESSRRPKGWWNSQEGYDEATEKIKKFIVENKKLPSRSVAVNELDLSGFFNALSHKQTILGDSIANLKEFLVATGISIPANNAGSKKSLDDAVSAINKFYYEHEKLPTYGEAKNLCSASFLNALRRGNTYLGNSVKTYSQFLSSIGFENAKSNKWTTEEGLYEVLAFVEKFSKDHARVPRIKDVREAGCGGFVVMLAQGRTVLGFETTKYSQFIERFGFNGIKLTDWEKESGYERAKDAILRYFAYNKRIPSRTKFIELGFGDFLKALSNKETVLGGTAITYPQFIEAIGFESDPARIWSSKEEYDKALSAINDLMLEKGRVPTQGEMRENGLAGFLQVMQEGRSYLGENVTTYNQLLKAANLGFRNMWCTQVGLDQVIDAVTEFLHDNNRMPTELEFDKELHLHKFLQYLKKGDTALGRNVNDYELLLNAIEIKAANRTNSSNSHSLMDAKRDNRNLENKIKRM